MSRSFAVRLSASSWWFAALNLAFVCILGAAAAATKQRSTTAFPTDLRVERGVAHLSADRAELADLCFPREIQKNNRLPAVVLIHGGDWNGGKRELNIGGTLARHGYVVMSIDYTHTRGTGHRLGLDPGAVPFLILHGAADNRVNIDQSHFLAATLEKAGVPREFGLVPDAPRTFDPEPTQPTCALLLSPFSTTTSASTNHPRYS